MAIPHAIPYQGSKRNLANYILAFFPKRIKTLFEPFCGSAALSIAAAYSQKATKFHINDINKPLIELLEKIINNPEAISQNYHNLWHEQLGQEPEFYNKIRNLFNESKKPEYFLYLLARCVKASVRYNSKGEFNQSPDHRRRGKHPTEMKADILATSTLLKNKTTFSNVDYKLLLSIATSEDLIYMDPPYQGVCNKRDPRYIEGINHDEFINELETLNNKNIPFILSYDGKKGSKIYGPDLPDFLKLKKCEIMVGRSSQSTLLGRKDYTYESLYLSRGLYDNLEKMKSPIMNNNYNYQFQF